MILIPNNFKIISNQAIKMAQTINFKTRINWSLEEQQLIKHLRETEMITSWKLIAKRVNENFPSKNRSSKQCRQRYMNYMKFSEDLLPPKGWTFQQDLILLKSFRNFGPKWSLLSSKMNGRSQNCLKNRFHGIVRKIMRKIIKYQKQFKLKHRKQIKSCSVIQILQQNSIVKRKQKSFQLVLSEEQNSFVESLSNKIIDLALNQKHQGERQQWLALITNIRKYNQLMLLLTKKTKQSNCHSYLNLDLSSIVCQIKFSHNQNPNNMNLLHKSSFEENQMEADSLFKETPSSIRKIKDHHENRDLFDILNQQYQKSPFLVENNLFY